MIQVTAKAKVTNLSMFDFHSKLQNKFSKWLHVSSFSSTIAQQSWNQLTNNPIFNSLPDDKILDCSKLKDIADNILKCI